MVKPVLTNFQPNYSLENVSTGGWKKQFLVVVKFTSVLTSSCNWMLTYFDAYEIVGILWIEV